MKKVTLKNKYMKTEPAYSYEVENMLVHENILKSYLPEWIQF
ncbi:hypothetical protein MmTuc01_0090 [Methanosarcina mazei Tuc01]|uniref:Uncharacterized protein n=1 Tax=Methanosarcina mazei Tuc01 TaxID=1236903 RepID=M1P5B2_METMZ|nr:hypothetical protein MmTuc01_0090 [Methanosarcina mazei Tuc01]